MLRGPGAARRNLAVANWTNEEGARFQPSLTGSSVFAGSLSVQDAYACADGDGVTLGAALAAIGYCGATPLEYRPVCYVELHVEQGDRLEQASGEIAAVSGAWMTRKISVVSRVITRIRGRCRCPCVGTRCAQRPARSKPSTSKSRENAGAHASAARISVYPNSPNVVGGRARVWFEIRHEEEAVVVAISDRFLKRIERDAREIGVGISIAADDRRSAPSLDPAGVALILVVARDLGCKAMTLKTVTGHDTLAIQKRIPASLIFVPSRGGLSHNPREFTAPEALDKGYAVLVETLWRMVTAV